MIVRKRIGRKGRIDLENWRTIGDNHLLFSPNIDPISNTNCDGLIDIVLNILDVYGGSYKGYLNRRRILKNNKENGKTKDYLTICKIEVYI